jgi:hypothetical protein
MLFDKGGLEEGTFVGIEAQPVQAFKYSLDHRLGGALNVGVLDAKNVHAAVLAREQPVEESGARSAKMKITGGRRCKSNSYGVGHNDELWGSAEKKGKLA